MTGGTGFVGKHVVRALLARGFLGRCLVRPGSQEETVTDPARFYADFGITPEPLGEGLRRLFAAS